MIRRRPILAALLLAATSAVAAAKDAPKPLEEKYDSGMVKARYAVGPDGVKNGPFQVFYESGKPRETGDYQAGQLHGLFYSFHENGQPDLKCGYKKGALDGPWSQFDDKGKKTATAEYRDGKKNGIFRQFDVDRIVSEQLFVDDALILPRSEAMIAARLAEIRKTKIETVPAAEPVPEHRGQGKTSDDDRAAGVRTLMEYRYLCDVPCDIKLDAVYNAHDEAAAAILSQINKLDHRPENPGWPKAEYDYAFTGTSSSNLYMGITNAADAVRGFMDDSDPTNIDRIGHRRWCINPGMEKTGFGAGGKFLAMWSFDNSRKDVPDYDFVAYPARGLFPNTHFRPAAAWSLSLNPKKYKPPEQAKIQVIVKPAQLAASPAALKIGPEIKLSYFHVDNAGFGIPNAIIFRFDKCSVQPGSAYTVEVAGLQAASGEAATVKYFVQFYAPSK